MFKLFSIEWMKVKNYRAFWVLFLSFIILFPLTLYFISYKFLQTSSSNQEEMVKKLFGSPVEFPRIWVSSSWLGGLFFLILGMLFILLITNEVQYRTHRQNIIDGWSRTNFLMAKFSMMLFLIIIATLTVFISGYLIGKSNSTGNVSFTEQIYYLGYFALMSAEYLMVAFLIAILIKRTGLSIIIYFAVTVMLDNILWAFLTRHGSQVGYFLPLECTDSLVSISPSILKNRTVPDSYLIATAFGYITIFSIIIISYFQRSDLKT